MPSLRGVRPLIRWGATFQNDLVLGLPFDRPRWYPEPAEGSSWVVSPSGVEDAFVTRFDRKCRVSVRWMKPTAPVVTPEAAAAWDGLRSSGDGLGVTDFLMYAWAKNPVRLYLDGRNALLSPTMTVDTNADGVVNDFTAQTSSGVTVTRTLDGTEGCQKIAVTANTGTAGATAAVQQAVAVIPGETVSVSAFLKTAALTGGAKGFVNINWLDAGGAFLSGVAGTQTASTASYAQCSASGAAPAGAFSCRIIAGFICAATGETGTVFVKQAMVERKLSASAAFIDSSAFKSVYLMEPMKGEPKDESNVTDAALDLVFRTTDDTAFTGI